MNKKLNKLLQLALCMVAPIALLIAGTLTMTAASDVISDGNFERGLSPWKEVPKAIKTCCNHSLKIVTSPTRAGKNAARFTLKESDNARRAELRSVHTVPANSEAWYGFSVYFPTDWVSDRSYDIIAQYGAPPDKNLGESRRGGPPLALIVKGETLSIFRQWDANSVTTRKSKNGKESINIGTYQTGVWTDFVIHVKWSYKSDGFIQVYKNGKLVVDKKGPTNRNDRKGVFFNIGIYKPQYEAAPEVSITPQRVIYFDEIRIGNASASYKDVAPNS